MVGLSASVEAVNEKQSTREKLFHTHQFFDRVLEGEVFAYENGLLLFSGLEHLWRLCLLLLSSVATLLQTYGLCEYYFCCLHGRSRV